MSVEKAAAACSTLICWTDQHEGFAAWVGAVATFLAVVTALYVAFDGKMAEAARRREERKDQLSMVLSSLGHAHSLLHTVYKHGDENPDEPVGAIVTLSLYESALAAVKHALGLPFADPEILFIALNTQSLLNMMREEMMDLPKGPKKVRVVDIGVFFNAAKDDLAEARLHLRKLGADVGPD